MPSVRTSCSTLEHRKHDDCCSELKGTFWCWKLWPHASPEKGGPDWCGCYRLPKEPHAVTAELFHSSDHHSNNCAIAHAAWPRCSFENSSVKDTAASHHQGSHHRMSALDRSHGIDRRESRFIRHRRCMLRPAAWQRVKRVNQPSLAIQDGRSMSAPHSLQEWRPDTWTEKSRVQNVCRTERYKQNDAVPDSIRRKMSRSIKARQRKCQHANA